ncbi:Protoglobin-domain-containing protein [Amylocarpus encephaloides]|uniref:Protoglobin-domain-containing protein n=1 Tax=Amylocarpus encephaloides TaxID=45428 RepID=A0A9P7YSL9_9HELO|nr:Protoglobin-domain-containing protein [Amylocarpus encephaloides]
MQSISATSLVESLPERIAYLSSFLSFTEEDTQALLASAPLVAPLIPTILDAVYTKLLNYDITAKAFVPKNTDYTGETVKSVQELTLESPQIAFRKDFLKALNYLVRLVTTKDLSPTSSFWTYLNNVGIMHTGRPGFKHREKRPDLKVDYIHMSALLGYVEDIVVAAVLGMDEIDLATKTKVIRAFNKMLWIQNDLMSRHYISGEGVEDGLPTPPTQEGEKVEGDGCPFKG